MARNSAKYSAKSQGSWLKLGTLILFAEHSKNLLIRSLIRDLSDPSRF
jgi:hypothetical protein